MRYNRLQHPPPPIAVRLLGSLGETVRLFNEVRHQPSYIYSFLNFNHWTQTVPFVKSFVILYGPCFLYSSLQQMPAISTYTRSPVAQSCVNYLVFSWKLSMFTCPYSPVVITRQSTTDAIACGHQTAVASPLLSSYPRDTSTRNSFALTINQISLILVNAHPNPSPVCLLHLWNGL